MEDDPNREIDPMGDDPNEKINPEEWLYYLVQINGNSELRNKIYERVAQRTGFPMEKVEVIMKSMFEALLNIGRSN